MGAKNKLTPAQVLIDQRLEAAPPARVQPPPVPVPDAAPAPELQEEDPPPARSQEGQLLYTTGTYTLGISLHSV